MRKLFLLVLAVLVSAGSMMAQKASSENVGKTPFAIKAYAFRGTYLDNSDHFTKFHEFTKDGKIYPAGVNLGVEFPSAQQLPWQQYLNNATLGVGMTIMDFGGTQYPASGKDMLGMSVAVYPYMLFNAIDSKYLKMRFKVAAGLAAVTQHWYTQEDTDPEHYYEPTVNTIFGCYLNVYLNAGINLSVPITDYLALGGEFGYFHISNGRTCMPNIGMNAAYGSLGVTATFNEDKKKKPITFPDQPYGWALNFTGALGAQKSAIEDTHRFLISNLHAGAVYHVNNWYGIGAGFDVFYNGAVTSETGRNLYCKGYFGGNVKCKSCDGNYTAADKIRAGIAMNNEFKFGRLTAIVDWGVYLYNPSRNLYYDYHFDHNDKGITKRPLLYNSPYGAGSEEAFHYIRFGMKCRVWDNLYLQASAKTHMHICEFIEFGLGYQIPFFKWEGRDPSERGIFHHKKNWWLD